MFTQHIGLVVPIADLLGLFSGRSDISRCRLGPSSPEPLRTSEEKYFFRPALHQDVACLGLLEQVDALLDPHAELLLCLLTLVQVPLGQHLVHLVGFSSFFQVLGGKIVLDGHLTERAKDGATLLLVARVDDVVHPCYVLGVFLYLGGRRFLNGIIFCKVGR